MRIFVTGATGFIGRAVVARLRRDGHQVRAWVRSTASARALLGAEVGLVDAGGGRVALQRAVDGSDAVVNLAGEPLFGRRWTEERRRALVDSRVGLTRDVVDAMATARRRPGVLVQASAVGYYGDRGDESLDETSAAGDDFAATLCARWEREAQRAAAAGARVCAVRIGIVLGPEGGALQKMLTPFRFGVGGRLGNGRQYMSWIHLDDLVEIFAAAVADARYTGVVNGVAPNPVTNRVFTRALARELSRPAFLPVPAFALRAAVGDAASLLLGSQRVTPAALRDLGFRFRFPYVGTALADILGDDDAISIRRAAAAPDTAYLRRHPARYTLRQEVAIDAPIDEVFAFFSRPENLGALTPPDMAFRIDGAAPAAVGEGTTIDYTIQLGPVPIGWRTRIESWREGHSFVDVQERGPYRSWWHRHMFRAVGRRTIMEDRVYYSPPLGLLGRIAHRLFIARALRRVFRYRSAVIARRFGAAGDLRSPGSAAAGNW